MNKIIFQIMGALAGAFAAAMVLMGIYATTGWSLHLVVPPSSRSMFWTRLLAFNIPLAVVAVGLFLLRKWAALLASTAGLYVAFFLCKEALYPVNPQNWNWLGCVYAFLFTIPSIASAKYWNTLAWRGRKTPPPPPPP